MEGNASEVLELAESIDKYSAGTTMLAVLIVIVMAILTCLISILLKNIKSNNKSLELYSKSTIDQNNKLLEFLSNNNKLNKSYDESHLLDIHSYLNNLLRSELQSTHDIIKADRLAVYLFNNGRSSINNFPYFGLTCIIEYVTNGIQSYQVSHNNLPYSIFNNLGSSLISTGEFNVENIKDLKDTDPALFRWYDDQKVRSLFCRALYSNNHQVVGYITAEYMNNYINVDNIRQIIDDNLEDSALRISPLIDIDTLVNMKGNDKK